MPGIPLPARFRRERDELALDKPRRAVPTTGCPAGEMRGLSQLLAGLSVPAAPATRSRSLRRCPGSGAAILRPACPTLPAGPTRCMSSWRLVPHHARPGRRAVNVADGLGGTAAAYATQPIRRDYPEFHVTTPQGKGRLE